MSGRQLYAADINGGNGNMRRTLLSLFHLGLLDWDALYKGRVVLTAVGTQTLQTERERRKGTP